MDDEPPLVKILILAPNRRQAIFWYNNLSFGFNKLIPIYQDSTPIPAIMMKRFHGLSSLKYIIRFHSDIEIKSLWSGRDILGKLEMWLLMSSYCVDSITLIWHAWKWFESHALFHCKIIYSHNHTSMLLSLYKDACHHQCEQSKWIDGWIQNI